MRRLPLLARIYIAATWLAALAIFAVIPSLAVDWWTLGTLAVAYLAAEVAASINLRRTVTVSVSFPLALAGVLLLPPSAAALVVATVVFADPQHRRSWTKRLFNGAMQACCAAAAGTVYQLTGGGHEIASGDSLFLPQALLAAITYCLVNGLLLAGVLRTAEGLSLPSVWRSMLSSSIAGYLGYGLVGVIIAALWHAEGGRVTALLVLLPLYVARWVFAQYAEEREAHEASVRALVQAVETKDHYTRGHSERVSRASVMIAEQLDLSEDRTEALRLAGMLHDLGKLSVPTRLLQKSGPLTEAEYEAIQLHPVRGVEVVRGIEFLREAYNGILHHHERFDGRGYPHGLAGHRIPEFARVIAAADAFDCMTSTRAYRSARSIDEALAELRRCAGAQFDPEMVRALEKAVGTKGWDPALAPAATEVLDLLSAQFDHDDPTVQVPLIRDGQPTAVEPTVRIGPRQGRDPGEESQ